jgi:hypothetical protein
LFLLADSGWSAPFPAYCETVRLENTTSWRAGWSSENEIDVALYIRDALALSVSEGQVLPPVEPQVPVHVPPEIDRAAVQAQWADWWVDLLAFLRNREDPDPRSPRTRYGRPALAQGSAMRLALDFFGPAAARHFANARGAARRGRPVSTGARSWPANGSASWCARPRCGWGGARTRSG